LITALLAIEDKRFFEHSGIDLRSWLRVFKGIATNTSGLGGGSTLSQQLAKNLFPRKYYGIPGISIFINKVKENIISIKLEKLYNKEELLTMYLNTCHLVAIDLVSRKHQGIFIIKGQDS
jgi:penicillin-binding protein 1A